MGRAVRLLLGLLLALGALRAVFFLIYAFYGLSARFETFHLESKMALLAYRVQAGLPLYPSWRDYPHVANFFGPLYFVVVGLLGRVLNVDLPGLFLVGRGVTFLSALSTTLGLGWYLGRRYGRGAALAGVVFSLGAAPMFGFSVMVRSDLLAESLGVGGFFLSGLQSRRGRVIGGVLLILAMLTKQTTIIFLAAAALALFLEGERRHALALFGGSLAALMLAVVATTLVWEPNFARDFLGEAKTSWSLAAWLSPTRRLVWYSPDLLVFSALGLMLWLIPRPRDLRLAALTIVILGASLVSSRKRGAGLNYYLSLRVLEALAVGTLWHVATIAKTGRGRVGAILATVVGIVALLPGAEYAASQAFFAWKNASFLSGPAGRSLARVYQRILHQAEDPRVRLLTDSGLFDVYQKDRAAFGDPWMFRMLVDTGQLQPTKMRDWIDSEAYDLVVTTSDIYSPIYGSYEFGLPMMLVDRLRVHYVPIGSDAGLFFYKRRGVRPSGSLVRESLPNAGR